MPQEISTAISDFVLAAVTYSVAVPLLRHSRTTSAVGFFFIAIAASLGTLKFGLPSPPTDLVRYHLHASWFASVAGVALVAVDYHLSNRYQSRFFTQLSVLLLIAIPVVTVAKIFNVWSNKVDVYVTDAIGGLSILSLLFSSIAFPNASCLFGSVLYIAAGLIGTKGSLYGLKRVDWFHYLLAFGNIGYYLALRYKPGAVYFKSR